MARNGEEHTIAINDSSFGGNEQSAVGVSIESDTERGAFGGHALLQFLQVERAATRVDIAPIGFGADANDVVTERREQFRAKLVSGAIGAVKNDAKTFVRSAGDGTAAEEIQILMMERVVRNEISWANCGVFCAISQEASFDLLFDGIGELHAFMRKEFDAVVLIRIVRCGDDDADMKIVVADKAGDAGSGEYAGK